MHTEQSAGGDVEPPPAPSSKIIRWLEWPVRLGGIISTALIFLAFILVIYAISQRYFLNTPLKWGDEMLGYLLVAIVMTGAAEAYRLGDQIAIDLISARLKSAFRRGAEFFSAVSVLVFSTILFISSDEVVRFSYSFGSYSPGYLEAPMWIPQSALIVGAFLLILASVARLLRLGRRPN
ncbi:MAG: TRAP transporter small permease [Boseongicola sp.]